MPGCKRLLIVMYDFSRNEISHSSKKIITNTAGVQDFKKSSEKTAYEHLNTLPHNQLQELMSEGNC